MLWEKFKTKLLHNKSAGEAKNIHSSLSSLKSSIDEGKPEGASFIAKRKSALFFLIPIILIVFGAGVWFGKTQVVCEVCQPSTVDFSLFWNAWKMLQDKFVDKTKFNTQDMIYGAIDGLVKSLNDPYTVFMKPEDSKIFTENIKGSFEGVGMEIDIKNDQLQVVSPLENTPAQKAGIRAGDKITKINGTSTVGISVDKAVNLIRGPKGTTLTLTIYRDEWKEERDIKLTRDVIEIPSLKLETKGDNIAYLKLYEFSEKASYDFQNAAINILNNGTQKIILDLRDDPGGYLEVAQDIAGWFLPRGQIVTTEDYGQNKEQNVVYKAQGNASLVDYPLVILINKGSASASEILAGALRDNRGVKLIGETSFGKGSVQEMQKLPDNSSIKITVAKWLTPKGESISEKGLTPDIKVEMTADDYKMERDPQLEKAIEIIKGL